MKTQIPTENYIRFFHALPTPDSLDLYWDDQKLAKDFLYEDFTRYFPTYSGEHHLMVTLHHMTEPLYEATLWLSKQKIYTIVLSYTPQTTSIQSTLVYEPPKAIPDEQLLIRSANFSQLPSTFTLQLMDTKPIFKKIPLRQASSYLAFSPATATLELTDLETHKSLQKWENHLFKTTRYYTLYLIGGTKEYPLRCIQTIDGNSFLRF